LEGGGATSRKTGRKGLLVGDLKGVRRTKRVGRAGGQNNRLGIKEEEGCCGATN